MWLSPTRLAMAVLDSPWAQASTICARYTTAWGSERERAMLSSWYFSSSLSETGVTGRPRGMSGLQKWDTLIVI